MVIKATRNIILIDDHAILRDGLKELIEKLGPYKISRQFDNGEEFIKTSSNEHTADLIILDLQMPGMGGDEVIEKMNIIGIKVPVLILTICDEEDMISKVFKLGVRGYLMKNCDSSELKIALNDIFTSGYYDNEFRQYALGAKQHVTKKTIEDKKPKDYALFKVASSEGKVNIKISDILYVETNHAGRQNKAILLKNGTKLVITDCSFEYLLEVSPYLVRINKSELISIEAFEKIKGDLITLKIKGENGKPKRAYLNRWFRKYFMSRLSYK